jgi:ATP/maltotriose-dependent transcriptional regulator MalT
LSDAVVTSAVLSVGGARMFAMARPTDIPLVARTEQVQAIRAVLERGRAGQPGTLLLSGDAGVGKTRLVEEAMSLASAGGACVLVGHCLDLGEVGLPYLPFAEALSHLQEAAAAEPDGAVARALAGRPALSRLLGHGDGAPSGGDDVSRLQLFDAVGGLLTDLAASHGLVLLVLEDLHWADQSTRDLMRFLVARARDQHVVVLGTYRADDLHRRHPLRPMLAELFRHPTVERLEVPPFTEAELREFVETVTTGGVPEREVRQVMQRSEGNAYFAEELLESGATDGALPDSLSDVLLARVERLDPQVQELTRVASVAGRRVSEALLRAVTDLSPEQVDDALREAVAHHALVPVDSGFFVFRHALLAEAVYNDLLPGERVRLHAAYAKALADGTLGSAAELAHHALAAHDLPASLSASLAAADEAARRLAPSETLRHLEAALQLWQAVPDAETRSGATQVEVLLRATGAATRAGALERSIALAREAVKLARAAGDVLQEATARQVLAQVLLGAEQPGAWEESACAVRLLTGEPGSGDQDALVPPSLPKPATETEEKPVRELVLAAAVHARTSLNSDRDEEAEAWAEWALEQARCMGDGVVEADALTTLAVVRSEEPQRARELLEQAQARAAQTGELGVELRSTYNLAGTLYYSGDVAGALAQTERGRRRAEETGTRWSLWGLEIRVLDVIARYVMGDWDGSTAAAALVGSMPPDLVAARLSAASLYTAVGRGDPDALDLTERLRPAWHRDGQIALIAGGCRADALTWSGQFDEAVGVAREVLAFLTRAWNDYFLGGIWLSALALAALAEERSVTRGAVPEKRRLDEVDELLQHAVTTAQRGRPRFAELGPEGRGWLARAHAEHARAHGRPDVKAWTAAVEEFGDWYPYEQARSRWRLVEALLDTGERETAAEELRLAHATARRLGAVPLENGVVELARRARLDLTGTESDTAAREPSPLTPREAAVLALVAEGLTNRQVGERLFISDKTVSVHLSNVMAKLGASGRTEAVSVAYRRGLLQPS